MANLLPILRTQFVLIKCQSSATSVFEALELLYGMQGVTSSSLRGSTRFSASGTPRIEK
jgi:hypothetical protein